MRWFTRRQIWGPHPDDEFDDLDENGDEPHVAAYRSHLDDIESELPDGARELLDVVLHDGRVESYAITGDRVVLTIVTNTAAQHYERVTLIYSDARVVDPAPGSLEALHLLAGDTDLLDWELDRADEPGRFVHRGFVWQTGQYSIVFGGLDVRREAASSDDYGRLCDRPDAPEEAQVLAGAWLEFLPPLLRAAGLGLLDEVELLLATGADPTEADEVGFTALHLAANRTHLAVCRALLRAGAPVDAVDDDGVTPLMGALNSGDRELLDTLVAAGADPFGGLDDEGVEALGRAANWGNVDGLAFVLDHGGVIDRADGGGFTPLMTAAEADRGADAVRYLLERGADPRIVVGPEARKEYRGKTAAELAKRLGRAEAAAILRSAER